MKTESEKVSKKNVSIYLTPTVFEEIEEEARRQARSKASLVRYWVRERLAKKEN
mgnify:CR=1 FL=1